MGKFVWEDPQPGETCFGGRGVLIHIDKKRMLSSASSSSSPAKTDAKLTRPDRHVEPEETGIKRKIIDDK